MIARRQDSGGQPVLEVCAVPSPADIAFIEDNLSAYNRRHTPAPDERVPLCVFVRDADGALLGGATGHTRWDWLYVDCFWLPDTMRQGGLGRTILAAAENEACTRGCIRACLFTYSFQAQGFYEKHGYTVFGTQEDYPPGSRKIWMRKILSVAA